MGELLGGVVRAVPHRDAGHAAPAEAYGDELLILGVERGGVEDFVARYGVTTRSCSTPASRPSTAGPGPMGCRGYFIGAEETVLREIVGPLDPARMVGILGELLAVSGPG